MRIDTHPLYRWLTEITLPSVRFGKELIALTDTRQARAQIVSIMTSHVDDVDAAMQRLPSPRRIWREIETD